MLGNRGHMNPPPSVLFVAYEASQMELFIQIAQSLRLQSCIVPILYCPYALPNEMSYRRACTEAGIEYLQEHTVHGGRNAFSEEVEVLAIRYSEPAVEVYPHVRPDLQEWLAKLSGYVDSAAVMHLWNRRARTRAQVQKVLEDWEKELSEQEYSDTLQRFAFWLETYLTELCVARALVSQRQVGAIILAEHIAERDSVCLLYTSDAADE